MLEVFRLRKEFPNVVAVSDLSFEIEKGKVCGFVGPNGAGKTTTMRMIATLDMPTRGEIRVDGVSIFDAPYAARRKIGFMPDHLGVYPDMTVTDYLEFYARSYEIEPSERDRRVGEVKEFTELDKIDKKLVETLSKGMRQRLNLGRALLNDPKLLVMDEPAAGLDPRARVELRELIKSLATVGKTIFISSHILTELGEMCDSMLVIERGEMVAKGGLDKIKATLARPHGAILIRLLGSSPAPAEGAAAEANGAPAIFPEGRDPETLRNRLLEMERVANVRPGPNSALTLDFRGTERDAAELLRQLVSDGYPVVEFAPKAETMEELFMMLTTGEVQ
jgi:ABC-2 type transport system ATP-binding protein